MKGRHMGLPLLFLILILAACGADPATGTETGNPTSDTQEAGEPVAAPTATLSSIAVTPASPSVTKAATQQFAATGTYSDSTTKDLTATVTWSSSDTAVATIDSAGLATAVAPGTTTITATSGSISGSTSVTITKATLTSIQANIFTSTCAVSGCHTGAFPSDGLNLSSGSSYSNLVNVDSFGTGNPKLKRVAPNSTGTSYLINKLEGTQGTVNGGVGNRMPNGGDALSTLKIQTIKDWINDGATDN